MAPDEESRSTKWFLAIGLACVPCTASFLLGLGGAALAGVLALQGWALTAVAVALAGLVGTLVVVRRRAACRP